MASHDSPRWGILGTAHIAVSQFLPALRTVGGEAYAVAGRDVHRTEAYARDHSIERAVEGYHNLLADERVDAVYIALPNSLHAEWTIAALDAGKAVLCEKPLVVSVEEAEAVLDAARHAARPLWEAFVFPFHVQMQRVYELIAGGAIGEVREIQSSFHFPLTDPGNIRLSAELAGGALNDVGCYSIRLAQLVLTEFQVPSSVEAYCIRPWFQEHVSDAGSSNTGTASQDTRLRQSLEAGPTATIAMARWAGGAPASGVDLEMQGMLDYPGDRRLLLSCGMARALDRFARLIGETGEIRLFDPFHPGPTDPLEVHTADRVVIERPTPPEPSFSNAIRHIHTVLRGEAAPRHTALDDSMATARALAALHRSARSGQREAV